jgi:hypothetical protein
VVNDKSPGRTPGEWPWPRPSQSDCVAQECPPQCGHQFGTLGVWHSTMLCCYAHMLLGYAMDEKLWRGLITTYLVRG